jgi:hypothetical protein
MLRTSETGNIPSKLCDQHAPVAAPGQPSRAGTTFRLLCRLISSVSSSGSPKRLIAQEFGVTAREPDILEHPVIEPGKLGAIMCAPPPFPPCREQPACHIALHAPPAGMRERV